jgi:hypothetical protein
MDPPLGADMHWSRLVDVPIAAFLLLFRLFLPEPAASAAAMTAVPLGQLLIVMLLMRRLLEELGAAPRTGLIAAAIVPLFPLLTTSFAPLRIDHHGWQAIAALACAVLLMRAPDRRSAVPGGIAAALWLSVSLEGLPMVALIAAIYGLRFLLYRDGSLAPFLAGLAIASPVLFMATRPASQVPLVQCDVVSWPHMAAFAAAAAIAAGLNRVPLHGGFSARLAGLAAIAGVALAIVLPGMGGCAIDPWANFDPYLKSRWLERVTEGMPLTGQSASTALMLVWTLFLAASGWWLVQRKAIGHSDRWSALALLALGSGAMSLLVMRAGINAQILTVPFAALLIDQTMPRARAISNAACRIVATLACLLLGTPTFITAAVRLVEVRQGLAEAVAIGPQGQLAAPASTIGPAALSTRCDVETLARLPKGHMFALLGLGPEVIVRTGHTVVTSGYHRNAGRIREVMDAFSGDPARAEAIVRSTGANYVLSCMADKELAVHASVRAGNLANLLIADQPPAWLEPVEGFQQGVQLYRVKP